MQKYSRTQKIIQPGFQFRLVGMFTGIGTLALLLQFMIVGFLLTGAAATVQNEGGNLLDELPGVLLKTMLFSLGMLVPVLFGMGILLTFRVAGPAHRMKTHLRAIANGAEPGPCRIREGDQLQDLCAALNAALARLSEDRRKEPDPAADEPAAEGWTKAA